MDNTVISFIVKEALYFNQIVLSYKNIYYLHSYLDWEIMEYPDNKKQKSTYIL